MKCISLLLLERVESTDGQDSQQQWWSYHGWLERCRMQEREMMVKEVEVRGQVPVKPALAG